MRKSNFRSKGIQTDLGTLKPEWEKPELKWENFNLSSEKSKFREKIYVANEKILSEMENPTLR